MYASPAVNSTVELLQYENTVLLNGMLGIGILILVFVVLFIRMSVIKSNYGFAVASIVTAILSVLLYGLELIIDYVLVICLLLGVISVIHLVTSERE